MYYILIVGNALSHSADLTHQNRAIPMGEKRVVFLT